MKRIATLAASALLALSAAAQTDTTFTYQGSLNEGGSPADGSYDFTVSLWDAPAGGSQIGSRLSFSGQPVDKGLFTLRFDFGASAFDGAQRWVEITIDGSTLAPRQPVTRTPYAIQTRGISTDDDARVGVGTVPFVFAQLGVETDRFYGIYTSNNNVNGTGVFGLATADSGLSVGVWGQSDSTDGRGVFGRASASSGTSYGVYGQNDSPLGRGVFGLATGSSGDAVGVLGRSFSTSGSGVYGEATASSGFNYGVWGRSDSTSGRGVFGQATAATGVAYGVRGESDSTTGTGVYGEATAATGFTNGVAGLNGSTDGRGVLGWATASSGTTSGVWGRTDSTTGRGLYGEATASSGFTYGVWGRSSSTSGRGVFGQATAATGVAFGVRGESSSTTGTGVYGEATAATGFTNGVAGLNDSTDGRGVLGWATASSGTTYGVRGRSDSTTGRGLLGEATASSGVNYGVWGRSSSPAGFDFFASGAGTNYGSSSSIRWKSDIEPIADPLDTVAKIRGVTYTWDQDHGGRHDVGFIAEELGAVLPEIVAYEENGVDAIGLDYSKLTPLLVEAVKELRSETDTRVEALRDENRELRDRIARLEQLIEGSRAGAVALNTREHNR